ncbi:MAG: glutamate mutase L [Anaerolineales bacterium]|nr:glutamate mutase L [Anaerolineales bacterium]
MPSSQTDADSLLTIDVGSINTQVTLFDVVDGKYRFLASGSAPTTAGAPFNDIGEGIRRALDRLHTITGWILVGADEQLIVPRGMDGSGVDAIAATVSVGQPIRVIVTGLLDDVSLESARNLALSTYAQVEETFGLNDRRKLESRIDAIMRVRPDLIVISGGTDGGASQAVRRLMEVIGLGCYLMPEKQRPEILYAGNQALVEEVKAALETYSTVNVAPNIRPDLEVECLEAAYPQLASIFRRIQSKTIVGLQELEATTNGNVLSSADGIGRIIRYLSKIYGSKKGVFGVDVGASATVVAAAHNGNLRTGVFSHLSLGEKINGILEYTSCAEIIRWLPFPITEDTLREYIYSKHFYPASIPVTPQELLIEQAIARELMRLAYQSMTPGIGKVLNPKGAKSSLDFEPIVASGSVLVHAPKLSQSVLMLLDAIQPSGITTLVLDQYKILPSLGVAAAINPLMAVQVLESNTFQNLGCVISPVGKAKPGTVILKVKITYSDGNETTVDIKAGSLGILPIQTGQSANLQLRPLHGFDVGMGGGGRGGRLKVVGGEFGVIIDARGRPLGFSKDLERQRERNKKWLASLDK